MSTTREPAVEASQQAVESEAVVQLPSCGCHLLYWLPSYLGQTNRHNQYIATEYVLIMC